MRNIFLILVLSVLCIDASFAQSGKRTVRLRNGSILIGTLSKSRDGNRMRIETPNGSVIYFTEKAVKEMVEDNEDDFDFTPTPTRRQTNSNNRSSGYDDLYDENDDIPPLEQTNSNYRDQRRNSSPATHSNLSSDITGYRGFVDLGYTIGMGDYSHGRFELTTSHGFQINPYVFIGGGTGFHYYKLEDLTENILGIETSLKSTLIAIPIFADIRANFIEKGPVIPFGGIKAGYSIGIAKTKAKVAGVSESISDTEGLGFYLAPSFGLKYMISPSMAMNFSVGYTMQFSKVIDPSIEIDGSEINIKEEKTKNLGGISLKVGFEF